MTDDLSWWRRPRRVSVVVDNESWVLPFAERLVSEARATGDDATLVRDHEKVAEGAVAFYLGCVHLTPRQILARNRRNLVVHASDLPKGRGFSPLTWQILEGADTITVCLFEAVEALDAGPIMYRERITFEGHELNPEMRRVLGNVHVQLCLRFLAEPTPPMGTPQEGEGSVYPRRRPVDSKLDPYKSLADQFNLLRVVDNDAYPAFFRLRGHTYVLRIEKIADLGNDGSEP